MLSYWEKKEWFSNIDFTIVGSGIVGINCALRLRARFPEAKIIILERGRLPHGASTKNAGFACFGSISEMIDDLKKISEVQLLDLVKKRISGLQLLRDIIGDKSMNMQVHGGYELFLEEDKYLYQESIEQMDQINKLLFTVYDKEIFSLVDIPYGMKKTLSKAIFNPFEGQVDTGMMMTSLLFKVHQRGIKILNNTPVSSYSVDKERVHIQGEGFDLSSRHLMIATNGFAPELVKVQMKPARAQVLITEPIKDLDIEGTFHLDKGYYYFRNIDNRILLGGGRNIDFDAENTSVIEINQKIQGRLDHLLNQVILPKKSIKVDQRWAGIMGVGSNKDPIVKKIEDHVYCGAKMGGMGIAIGSQVGKDLADLVET